MILKYMNQNASICHYFKNYSSLTLVTRLKVALNMADLSHMFVGGQCVPLIAATLYMITQSTVPSYLIGIQVLLGMLQKYATF